MVKDKRIILADDETMLRMELKEELAQHGYLVVGETGDGMSTIHLTRQLRPDLVLMDLRLSGIDGIEVAGILTREHIAPVVLLTASSDPAVIERATQAGIMKCLVKPWRQQDLYPALELALAHFAALCTLEARARSLEEQLATRKIIDRAKGLIMEQYDVTEQQAYSVLRTWSMDARQPLRTSAEAVLQMYQIARRIKASKWRSGKGVTETWGTAEEGKISPSSAQADSTEVSV